MRSLSNFFVVITANFLVGTITPTTAQADQVNEYFLCKVQRYEYWGRAQDWYSSHRQSSVGDEHKYNVSQLQKTADKYVAAAINARGYQMNYVAISRVDLSYYREDAVALGKDQDATTLLKVYGVCELRREKLKI
jgi:hypothetical protein